MPQRCRVLVLSSLFYVLFSAVACAAGPASVQLSYDVYKGSLKIGEIEESYTRDNDHYTLTSTTQATGLLAVFKPGRIIITSRGLVSPRGLQPLRFSDRREGEERRNRRADFDWEGKKLTLIHQEERIVLALPSGTQDRLSAMYQFMFLSLQPATSLDFPMTNGGKLDSYHYVVARGQKLKTPAGDFDTLYLENQPKKGESKTEIWLATEHSNLPCRMTITDADGGQFTQVLSKLNVTP